MFKAESLSGCDLNTNYDEDFGCIYFKPCNRSFHLYVMYLQIFLKIYFSCFHEVHSFLIEHCINSRILAIMTRFDVI